MNTDDKKFSAPWSLALLLMTAFSCALLLSVTLAGLNGMLGRAQGWVGVLPALLLLGAAFFVVRGYELRGQQLVIQRLGWTTTFNLPGLISATADPEAMKRSIRTFGNGGLFVFAGWYYNRKLGSYRAFCTDPARSVVLRFSGRVIVVTPEKPAEFVEEIQRRTALPSA